MSTLDAKLQCDQCGRDFSGEAVADATGTPCAGCENDAETCDTPKCQLVRFLRGKCFHESPVIK